MMAFASLIKAFRIYDVDVKMKFLMNFPSYSQSVVDSTSVKSGEMSEILLGGQQQPGAMQQRSNSVSGVKYSQPMPKQNSDEPNGVKRQLSRKDTFKRQVGTL